MAEIVTFTGNAEGMAIAAGNASNSFASLTLNQVTQQKPSMHLAKPVMAAAKEKKPSMLTEAARVAGNAMGVSAGGWKWYHWVILIIILAAVAYGGWYLYKKYK